MEYAIVQLPVKNGYEAKYYAGNLHGDAVWSTRPVDAVLFSWSDAIKRRDDYRALPGLTMDGRQAINVINVVTR